MQGYSRSREDRIERLVEKYVKSPVYTVSQKKMLSSNKISMWFWLCKCSECRKPRRHKVHKRRKLEYHKIFRKLRKKLWATENVDKYEDIDFTTWKYTD